jgi:deazaflavin-dependent oxidoreductase (nitroreductase family)
VSDAPSVNDWNQGVIEEFRANGGRVAQFEGRNLLLLHHTGAKTGTERVNPLVYQPIGENFAVFASKAGAPTNPDWYHNLRANPDTTVEVGDDSVAVRARVTEGDERDRIWEQQKRDNPNFAEYELLTTRPIPVVILERLPS